ncbi:YtxH domain-containing protein, partial [Staphylococcus epidermidis]
PSKFNTIKDEILYWKDTIDEFRRNNPELEKSIMDAKDTLVDRKNKRLGK